MSNIHAVSLDIKISEALIRLCEYEDMPVPLLFVCTKVEKSYVDKLDARKLEILIDQNKCLPFLS